MNSLGGIDIGDLILEKSLQPPLQVSVVTACDGSIISYERDLLYSTMILEGGDDWGFLTYLQMEALSNMSCIKGGIYELLYDSTYYNVRFMNEDSSISAEIVNPHLTKSKIKYKNVVIKLMEIE